VDEDILKQLRARRPEIRREWERLLRAVPAPTPLGHPDVLAHLIDRTLNVLFASLGAPGSRRRPAPPFSNADIRAECRCGRNPLLAYYLAGERALREWLVAVSADAGDSPPQAREKSLMEMYLVLHDISRRDVGLFCSLCRQRDLEPPAPRALPRCRAAIAANVRVARTGRRETARSRPMRAGAHPLSRPF